MPYISVEAGALREEQKEKLIAELTAVASRIMEVPETFFTVTIKELPETNYGIGGESLRTVKARWFAEHGGKK